MSCKYVVFFIDETMMIMTKTVNKHNVRMFSASLAAYTMSLSVTTSYSKSLQRGAQITEGTSALPCLLYIPVEKKK